MKYNIQASKGRLLSNFYCKVSRISIFRPVRSISKPPHARILEGHVCAQARAIYQFAKSMLSLKIRCSEHRRHGVVRRQVLPAVGPMADAHQELPGRDAGLQLAAAVAQSYVNPLCHRRRYRRVWRLRGTKKGKKNIATRLSEYTLVSACNVCTHIR